MKIPLTILERGDIYFFYWPAEAQEQAKLSQLFLVVRNQPEGLYKVISLESAHMPDMKDHHVQKGSVIHIGSHLNDLEIFFEQKIEKSYRGPVVKLANPLGEGKYLIFKWGKSTHFLYSLENLADISQKTLHQFGIVDQGVFMIQMKNMDDEKSVHQKPQGVRPPAFVPLDPIELFNEKGTQILMIGEKSHLMRVGKVNLQTILDSFSHEDILEPVSMEQKQKDLEMLLTADWN